MKVTIHTTAAGFDVLAAEWNTLLHGSVADTPFLTHEWQTAYWRALGEEALRIIEVRDAGGALVGLAPLFVAKAEAGPAKSPTEGSGKPSRRDERSVRLVGSVDPSD